jgi:hypothetical protein
MQALAGARFKAHYEAIGRVVTQGRPQQAHQSFTLDMGLIISTGGMIGGSNIVTGL